MQRDEILSLLRSHLPELRSHQIKSLAVFGSVARGDAAPDSDVDILVEFAPGARIGMFEFLGVQESLSALLGAPVDLATPASLHPRLRDAILREAILAA